jgi:hypothetical protein
MSVTDELAERFLKAHIRLSTQADLSGLNSQELLDIAAMLPPPAAGLEAWARAVTGEKAKPPAQRPEDVEAMINGIAGLPFATVETVPTGNEDAASASVKQ